MRYLTLLIALFASSLFAGEKMPEGPPWQQDIQAAVQEALKGDKPIFVYFTKTY
jgi:hypothetical protein